MRFHVNNLQWERIVLEQLNSADTRTNWLELPTHGEVELFEAVLLLRP